MSEPDDDLPAAPPPALHKLGGDITIFRANELKDDLMQALAVADQHLDLDLSDVQEIDTAGVQLLLSAQQEAAAQNKPLRCHHPSPQLVAVLALLNLTGRLLDAPATSEAGG
ncbi:STAS domain-containing protein [Silvimonas iriomotensis]|uniref:STAS domain-containing protein n=1 Tax=Silvimonas iriomotensis TaxID=449662 RepID=A0ABQ2PC69_9NEIS|nr:STAS domain-containing protein [Silvimonas iriomotensis]GGP22725.1 hypothetical protein GCM10010970_27250 [Silvimonas iriomotensis]